MLFWVWLLIGVAVIAAVAAFTYAFLQGFGVIDPAGKGLVHIPEKHPRANWTFEDHEANEARVQDENVEQDKK